MSKFSTEYYDPNHPGWSAGSGEPMKTVDEIRNTPVLLLTEAEISRLEPLSQKWARECQAIRARELACPGHEPTGTSTRSGWHSLKCKHCGMDMSYDSGD